MKVVECVPGTKIPKPMVSSDMDGNAFAVMGTAIRHLRRAKVPTDIINAYKKEAMSGDYDHLLATTMKYIEVT